MFSRRTKLSLAQFLSLQPQDVLRLLLKKYDFSFSDRPSVGEWLARLCLEGDEARVRLILDEALRTAGDLRNNVSPRYRFDQRFDDLQRCLELDGFRLEPSLGVNVYTLKPIDPQIEGAEPVEDDLTEALKRSKLPEAAGIISLLQNSAEDFRKQPPDFNGCLANARVALQSLATSIARVRAGSSPHPFDETKWGQVLSYLRTSGLITKKEEEGLSGVFSFISPGAHVYVGVTEQEMTRLGRSLAVGMCYFVVKKHLG